MITERPDKIAELKQICKHAEPNYGVLWFFVKTSLVENAIEVWDSAVVQIRKDLASAEGETWMGSKDLTQLLRHGLEGATFE